MNSPRPTISHMKTSLLTRLAALTGALYVFVAVLANDVLGSHSPDSSATSHAFGAWWAAHPPTTADWALGMLELVALLSFSVFVVVLA
jgi:hypothetical protein